MAEKRPKGMVRLILGLAKTVALVGGFPATVFCLMAIIGQWTDSFWIRMLGALIVALVIPLTLVDRLLPDDDTGKTHGIPSDVLSLCYLGVPLVYLGLMFPTTQPHVMVEADRLYKAGWVRSARASYWLTRTTLRTTTLPPATRKGTRRKHLAKTRPHKPASPTVKLTKKTPQKKSSPWKGRAQPPRGGKAGDKPPHVLFKECAPSIVSVVTNRGFGTGFLIDEDGTLVTNEHVIKNARYIRIKLYRQGWVDRVELLRVDAKADLALLRIHTDKPFKPLAMGNSDATTVGERVISIGNPLGLEHTLTDGLISSRRIYRGRKMLQMSAPVSPGNSGGPLLNMRGEVIGVSTLALNTGWFNRAQNLNMAVPINVLKKKLRDEYPKRRWVGKKNIKNGSW